MQLVELAASHVIWPPLLSHLYTSPLFPVAAAAAAAATAAVAHHPAGPDQNFAKPFPSPSSSSSSHPSSPPFLCTVPRLLVRTVDTDHRQRPRGILCSALSHLDRFAPLRLHSSVDRRRESSGRSSPPPPALTSPCAAGHHDRQRPTIPSEAIEMSDTAAKSEAAVDGDGAEKAGTQVATPAGPVDSNPVSPKAVKGEDGATETKSDSEAETVVLPGKEDATTSPRRKAIKHEGNEKPSKRTSDVQSDKKKKNSPDRDGDGKGKKTPKEQNNHTATSSNLSSTRSSPAPDPRSISRAGSESLQAKGRNHPDSDSISRTSHSRKRKMASEETDEKSHKRRQKRDGSLENAAGAKSTDGDRRDKSKLNAARSESPQPRTRNRAQSIKGASGTTPIGAMTTQRRKKPPPLTVGARGKTNDDDSGSDGSASPHGTSHLKRLVSGDASATSPAKMPPHKKLLDRNGRTWLARACDSEDAQIIRDRIQERPEELDVADYAQNTPLQIASLKGRHEIVKVLLDAGCKTDVKNIDQDTPLIDAVENGHLKVIKLLLAAGVNPRQSNAEGEDVMDLLNPEGDDFEDIKKLLTKARESRRRTSDDPQVPNTGRDSVHMHSPREASLNSPPPLPTGSRRRTARSEATRNDLLWVNATSQNLQNKARVGDDAAVDHILNMNPGCADIYSVLAATRGSHEVSLSLILAIGRPPADPDPIPGERGSQSTPMLAAIGRGNLRVIELLLEQPGFDPTRRLYNNKPYHEISKDRRGPQWDEEYRALKRAYDKAKGRNASGSSPSATKKSKGENVGSPSQERTKSQSDAKDAVKDVAVRKKPSVDSKSSQPRTDEKSPERSRQHTKKHLRPPSNPSSREASIAVSDREASPLRKSVDKKSRRSLSDTEDTEVQKPRKRLVSRRDLTEGDRQRRESMASVGSAESKDDSKARLAREQSGSQKIKREDIKREEDRADTKPGRNDPGKKRPRPETASPDDKTRDSQASADAAKKAKRLRVDAEGKAKKKSENDRVTSRHKSPGKESAATTMTSGRTKDISKASRDRKVSSRTASPAPSSTIEKSTVTKIKEEEPDNPSFQLQKEAREAQEAAKKVKASKKEAESAARDEAANIEAETRKREEAERKLKAEKEEAERKAKAEKEEAERKAKAEKEEAERKAKAEQEEAERKAKAEKEEAERKAREEEEARLEKKRQEEEQARKLAERERLRKEQEELQARRRKEQEEKERLAREKKQQEEERRRRELLPNALRIAAELGPEQAKQPSEVRYWLPLYTAEGHQLGSSIDNASKRELWIANIQAAPVLGITDLDLSQYTAWNKRSADDSQRLSLWRILRRKLARYQAPELGPADHQEEFRLDAEAHEKYDALKNIFWIRLSDLLDIVPRYPHLAGIDLKCCPIVIRPGPKVEPSAQVSPTSTTNNNANTATNGLSGRSALPNGYH